MRNIDKAVGRNNVRDSRGIWLSTPKLHLPRVPCGDSKISVVRRCEPAIQDVDHRIKVMTDQLLQARCCDQTYLANFMLLTVEPA